jgi:hypothetical protein
MLANSIPRLYTTSRETCVSEPRRLVVSLTNFGMLSGSQRKARECHLTFSSFCARALDSVLSSVTSALESEMANLHFIVDGLLEDLEHNIRAFAVVALIAVTILMPGHSA